MVSRLTSKIVHNVVYNGKKIEKIFISLVIICAICYPFVGVNYDLSKYLPEFAPTKQGLDVMEREFGYPGMARVMVKDVTLYEAKAIRSQIAEVDGVDLVIGVDSFNDVNVSDSFIDVDTIDDFYKDGCAIMEIVFEDGDSDKRTHEALDQIYKIVGDRGCYGGTAVSNKSRQETIGKEITIAMTLSLLIIFAILTLTTTSWFEPLLFILIMGVAIIINMGSNIMFGTISFFTFSTAAILQLAVSMDYSIFLLHTFTANKNQGMEIKEAMEKALHEASTSIFASGATTIVGFLAIALMKFTVGKDVGFVLTKGIIISLLTVMLLMPALIIRFNDRIEKYKHKPFFPNFDGFANAMYKIRTVVIIVAVVFALPTYVGQGMNHFLYGDDALGAGPGTVVYEDSEEMNQKFGKSNVLLAIVPNESIVKERDLTKELDKLDFIGYALSLSGTLPQGIPEDFLPHEIVKEFRTDNYARILISMETVQESDYAFQCSEKVESIVKKYYPNAAYVVGMTPTTIDIRDILTKDYNHVSILSMIGVALVVAITFGSAIMPLLVIIPIEVAIYLNMTIPYIIGDTMLYIGYIIVSCLQLGATIDYSILMTNNYLEARKQMEKQEAAKAAISKSALSILTSGSILTVVGYGLYFTSSIQGISQIGHLVGRGALLSMLLVLSLLPALLVLFDNMIEKSRQKADKRKGRRKNETL
ncbi:MAG TPA: multidrug transporter [Lachnospiraceae bacterium]|nr:multidrug transporter [Lachnospiraceae bacterium]